MFDKQYFALSNYPNNFYGHKHPNYFIFLKNYISVTEISYFYDLNFPKIDWFRVTISAGRPAQIVSHVTIVGLILQWCF